MEPWLVITIVLVVAVVMAANWLFRQRTPDEMRAALERLRWFRGRP